MKLTKAITIDVTPEYCSALIAQGGGGTGGGGGDMFGVCAIWLPW